MSAGEGVPHRDSKVEFAACVSRTGCFGKHYSGRRGRVEHPGGWDLGARRLDLSYVRQQTICTRNFVSEEG